MSEAELVDLGADPAEERRAARRRLRRVIAPLLAGGLLVLSVVGLVVVAHESNRRGALALSDDILASLEQRIEIQVATWLDPASRSLTLLRAVFGEGAIAQAATRQDAENLAIQLLRSVPSISLVSLADPRGNFVLQRRNEAGGVDTKTIQQDPGPRTVTWTRRDGANRVIATEDDPTDTFDARTRPWFIGALETDGVTWTQPYIFFTDRTPGVTASTALRSGEALRAVFGVDIRLDALSTFLRGLEIGETGRAMIIDRDGRLVAHPDASLAVRQVGDELIRPRLDEIGDPVLLRAFNLVRVHGPGRFTFVLDGEAHITIWAKLRGIGDGTWSVLITVPEKELVGFVRSTSRLASIVGGIVVAVALALAALLVRQGLRADRMERALELRARTMAAQVQALSGLGRSPSVHDPSRDEGLQLLTTTLADTLRARRTSLWRVTSGGDALRCDDSYDTITGAHASGQRLRRAESEAFFAFLARGEAFEAEAAADDPRTRDIVRLLHADSAPRRLLVVPLMRAGRLVGAALVEDRTAAAVPQGQAMAFALAIAGIAVARIASEGARRHADAAAPSETRPAALPRPAPARLPPPPPRLREGNGVLVPAAAPGEEARLSAEVLDRRGLAAEVFPRVTVMVLELSDASALAEPVGEAGGCALADQVVRIVQEAAAGRGVAYLRVMGSMIVAADGFGDRNAGAEETVAALAVDVAERCAALFSSLDLGLGFRIGLETGRVIGSAVGAGGDNLRTYNIWGDAVRAAETLARSAPQGAIQITGATRTRLSDGFMFRPRGLFWAPGEGEVATFLLAGRA